jgi:hypothetical protein
MPVGARGVGRAEAEMTDGFGAVAIPGHWPAWGVDLDELLPHAPRRSFHDERALPPAWPADV